MRGQLKKCGSLCEDAEHGKLSRCTTPGGSYSCTCWATIAFSHGGRKRRVGVTSACAW